MHTDGSAESVATVGWVGGWGYCSFDGWELAAYLPPQSRQTINGAELQAVIEVISHNHDSRLKIACTDSAYVYGGLQGGAHRWCASGWVTAQGPVMNVHLWSLLMTLLDTTSAVWVQVKVPTHIDIPGNEKSGQTGRKGTSSLSVVPYGTAPSQAPRNPAGLPPANRNGNGEPASMCTA